MTDDKPVFCYSKSIDALADQLGNGAVTRAREGLAPPVEGTQMTDTTETYLGDGLYASFDGGMLTLRAPREHGDHWVGLEPQVLDNLLRFAEQVGAIKARARVDARRSSEGMSDDQEGL